MERLLHRKPTGSLLTAAGANNVGDRHENGRRRWTRHTPATPGPCRRDGAGRRMLKMTERGGEARGRNGAGYSPDGVLAGDGPAGADAGDTSLGVSPNRRRKAVAKLAGLE